MMTKNLKVNELSWIVGGAQGSGVDSSATVFARAAASGGLHVYGKREYYSNIMGEHSYFQVRVCGRPIRSHVDSLNLLATFDAETVFRHTRNVVDDGAIVYDSFLVGTKLDDVPTIEARLRTDLQTYLVARGLGFTIQDILKSAADRGVTLIPIPYTQLLTQVADENHIDQLSKISRMVNMFAVAASFGILGYDYEMMAKALREVFRSKAEVAEMNVRGARKAYDLVHGKFEGYPYRLQPIDFHGEKRALMTGAQAIGLGKVLGGMRVQTYYPITPASDESEYIEANQIVNVREPSGDPAEEESTAAQESGSVLVLQTEDEIAAVTMAIGAALSGARAATCTSGPGFCLMMEGIGWAGINEVPLVITHPPRAGGPPVRAPRRTRGQPADHPRERGLRRGVPRRREGVQLRGPVPDDRDPPRRQGPCELERHDAHVRPGPGPDRPRRPDHERMERAGPVQAVRVHGVRHLPPRGDRPPRDDVLEHGGRAR